MIFPMFPMAPTCTISEKSAVSWLGHVCSLKNIALRYEKALFGHAYLPHFDPVAHNHRIRRSETWWRCG
jgi:hypothetical protein